MGDRVLGPGHVRAGEEKDADGAAGLMECELIVHRSGQGGQRRILPDHGACKGVGDHGGGGDGPIGLALKKGLS